MSAAQDAPPALLTKAEIFAAPDLKRERIAVPEWGGDVLVRGLTGSERDAFEESLYTGRGKDRQENYRNLRARLCALCIIDEHGTRVFSDGDVEELGTRSAAALDRLFSVAQRLSGIGTKDIEQLSGN